jgi:hypothetical protein
MAPSLQENELPFSTARTEPAEGSIDRNTIVRLVSSQKGEARLIAVLHFSMNSFL